MASRALHNVKLTLHNGMFGLLGPNGAGKSSLMRTIATLQAADTGTIPSRRAERAKREDPAPSIAGIPAAGIRGISPHLG